MVVMGIILILAALAILFVPKFQEESRAADGARQLQNWLLVAKQRALRDQRPTGVRLLYTGTYPNLGQVNDLMYVQQPDNYQVIPGVAHIPGSIVGGPTLPTRMPNRRITVTGTVAVLEPPEVINGQPVYPPPYPDFRGGLGNNPANWAVQPGDYLELQGGSVLLRILNVQGAGPNRFVQLNLASAPLNNIPLTGQYRIIRAPRPLPGEEPLHLPQDIAIDLSTNLTYNAPIPFDPFTNSVDIVFAPSGAVIGRGTAGDKMVMWVRDMSLDTIFDGKPTLISVNVRTGAIAAGPVDPASGDPYSGTRDPRSGGI
jgi:hypothetical protein